MRRIEQTLKKGLVLKSFLCLLVFIPMYIGIAVAAESGQRLLGDQSDGSRAHPIHRIPVFAEPSEQGKEAIKIDPNINTEEEVLLPFSARQTCGVCHNYEIIKGGWHFNSIDPNVDPGRPGSTFGSIELKCQPPLIIS